MITLDTSVWIDHLGSPDERVISYLNDQQVLMHPYVVGEIALGNLRNRRGVLQSLTELPSLPVASSAEVLRTIELRALAGAGIGFVDASLIASCLISRQCVLWTRDRRLAAVAERLGLAPQTH